jgi:hypothetical protein
VTDNNDGQWKPDIDLSGMFPAKNGFKQVVVLLPLLFNFALE